MSKVVKESGPTTRYGRQILASAGDAADAAPPVPLADEAARTAPALASSGETVETAAPLRASDVAMGSALL